MMKLTFARTICFSTGKKLSFSAFCFPLLGFFSVAAYFPALAQGAGRLVWLGTMGAQSSWVADVSDDGQVVVGWITVKKGRGKQDYAFRWDKGIMRQLEGIGENESQALAVSANGSIIAGWTRDSMGQAQMCIWENGSFRMLNVPAGQQGMVSSISPDARVIVGNVMVAGKWRAVRWVNGQLRDLGSLGGDESLAFAVSATGRVIVGWARASDGKWYAFRWEQGTMRNLGTFAKAPSIARSVSADGRVVVGGATTVDRHRHAFRWENHTLTDLGTLGGKHSEARAVSADGQVVVGWAMTEEGEKHAFRWTQQRGMEDLNEMYAHLLTDGSILTVAIALSPDARFIVGNGWNAKTGRQEAFWLDTQGRTGVPSPREGNQQDRFITFDPASWLLKIRWNAQHPLSVCVTIFDVLGRIVDSRQLWSVIPGQSPIQIPILPMPQGWYWCAVKIGDQLTVHPFFVSR